jgi:hypothetical protein
MTISSVQHRPYEPHLHAEDLSNRDSLPDVKAKQKPSLKHMPAELPIEAASQVAEWGPKFLPVGNTAAATNAATSVTGAAAVVAPITALIAGLAQVSAAHTEGAERREALQRDVVHTATLHLGRDGFGAEYQGYADAANARMADEYAHDSSSRALFSAQVSRTVTEVIKAEGGDAKARSSVAAGIRDGITFANDKGLCTTRDIDAMKRLNPQFRERYETDPTFHHGVNAVVWRAEHERATTGAQ